MNIAPTQPGRWDSPLLPLPATVIAINVRATHGRGTPPRQTRWVLVCLGPGEFNYQPGDELDVHQYNGTVPPATWANAVEVGFSHGANTWPLQTQNKQAAGGGVVSLTNTATRWALKCYCDW